MSVIVKGMQMPENCSECDDGEYLVEPESEGEA